MNEKMRLDSGDKAAENARSVWQRVPALADHETALTICDGGSLELGVIFHRAAREFGCKALWLVIPPLSKEAGEPIELAGYALRKADAYVGITSAGAKSLTHISARRAASDAGARGLTLPGFTLEMLSREAVSADYRAIASATESLAARLNGTSRILMFYLKEESIYGSTSVEADGSQRRACVPKRGSPVTCRPVWCPSTRWIAAERWWSMEA